MPPTGSLHTGHQQLRRHSGGISTVEESVLRVGFKPAATILEAKGRHDPGLLPRAVPMVEAMVALVLADQLLRQQGQYSLW